MRTELHKFMVGSRLGVGEHRKVYVFEHDPETYVIKRQRHAGQFHNVAEWEAWSFYRGTPLAEWFAPCHSISPSGEYLLMRRTWPMPPQYLPERVPAIFTDLKASNWGLLREPDGSTRPVCHDYGIMIMPQNNRLKRVEWE